MKAKRTISTIITIAMLLSLFVVPVHAASKFTDVADTAYYVNSVAWAVDKAITTGKTETTFAPNEQCTKAQIITFLWRAFGSPEPDIEKINSDEYIHYENNNPFTDLDGSEYYFKAAQWAFTSDMVPGNMAFNPNEPCSRKFAVLYMHITAGSPEVSSFPNFTDAPDGRQFRQAMAWAVDKGITNGTTETTFSPETICTRAQIVTFLYRYLGNQQTTQQTTTQQATGKTAQQIAEEESGMSLEGWVQLPNGTWFLGELPAGAGDTTGSTTQSQPKGPETTTRDLTPEEKEAWAEAAARTADVSKGMGQFEFDEEGGYYYYEW